MLCWHRWTVTDKTEQPSHVETAYSSGGQKFFLVTQEMTRRPVIVTYRCAKCGAEKVERI